MKDKKKRKRYTAQEKIALVRRHLVEKVPVSDLCQQNQIQVTQLYHWQQDLFEHGAAALEAKKGRPSVSAEQKRIAQLEAKLAQKNEVLAELMEEHIALKKKLGVI